MPYRWPRGYVVAHRLTGAVGEEVLVNTRGCSSHSTLRRLFPVTGILLPGCDPIGADPHCVALTTTLHLHDVPDLGLTSQVQAERALLCLYAGGYTPPAVTHRQRVIRVLVKPERCPGFSQSGN